MRPQSHRIDRLAEAPARRVHLQAGISALSLVDIMDA